MSNKKKTEELTIDPNKTYVFKLNKEHKGHYVVMGRTKVWDEDKKTIRIIRLTNNYESPFEDEQGEDAIPNTSAITFIKGMAKISGREASKIRYLLAHDGNIEKGSNISPSSRHLSYRWELVRLEEVFKKTVSDRKLKHQLREKLFKATKEELYEFAVATYGYKFKTNTSDELLDFALEKVEREPLVVKNNFATKESKLKAKIIGLFRDGTLKNNKGIVTWADGGIEVGQFKVDDENKLTDLMIEFIAKGSKEAKIFEKKLAAL